jgi:protoporphyrinogen oxidase
MKNILVVGGGVVGITAAYFAKNNNNNVIILESGKDLGGLLKSDCNKYGCFDIGTHIISGTDIPELDDFLLSDFNQKNSYQFNIGESGNYFERALSDISPYANSNHLSHDIYEKGCIEFLSGSNKAGENLEETMINRYGNTFYQYIFKKFIYKIFGCCAKELANECLNFFDMNRLLAFDELTTNERKKNKDLDEKLGFHSATKGGNKFYPKKGGAAQWIRLLEKKLIHKKVEIKKQACISNIKVKENTFSVTVNNKIIEVDELIWTLSSGLLNRFIKTPFTSNKPNFRKTAVYDFVFDQPIKTRSYYINVYDEKLLSTRITFYQNLQETKSFYACSVEVINNFDFDFDREIDNIKQELFEMKLIGQDSACIFSQCRILEDGFPSLTNKNSKILKDINSAYEKEYRNITLLGRNSAKGFFMSELLSSAYKDMKKFN